MTSGGNALWVLGSMAELATLPIFGAWKGVGRDQNMGAPGERAVVEAPCSTASSTFSMSEEGQGCRPHSSSWLLKSPEGDPN